MSWPWTLLYGSSLGMPNWRFRRSGILDGPKFPFWLLLTPNSKLWMLNLGLPRTVIKFLYRWCQTSQASRLTCQSVIVERTKRCSTQLHHSRHLFRPCPMKSYHIKICIIYNINYNIYIYIYVYIYICKNW